MLELFSNNEKISSSQSRSTTIPDLQLSRSDINAPPISTATVDGLHFDLMAPNSVTSQPLTQFGPSADNSVVEPLRSHQRIETERNRVNKDLPPLFTPPSQSSFQANLDLSELETTVQRNEFILSPQQSLQSSSVRSKRLTIPLFSGEKTTQGKTEEKVGKLANWFRGESEPINIGFLPSPTKEKNDNLETSGACSLIRPSNLLQRKSTAQGTSKPAMARRFSFFPSKSSLARSTSPSPDLNDELLDMDINKALFPSGPADPSSPAALKDLQQQAESILSRIQTAYRERTLQVREIAAEKEALAEEALGAETRAQHLKMQLNDMSVKFTEQDQAIMNLVDELAQEKLARREEEEARKRTLRLVEQASPPHTSHGRVSRAYTVSDSGFESEDESPAESLFSRRNGTQSPTMSMSSVSTSNSPDAYQLPDAHISTSASQAARLRIPMTHPVKGMPTPFRNDLPEEAPPSNCTNCHGGRASEAWSVLGVLQEENRCLKHRVGELEGALDGCLDVVTRLS